MRTTKRSMRPGGEPGAPGTQANHQVHHVHVAALKVSTLRGVLGDGLCMIAQQATMRSVYYLISFLMVRFPIGL